MGLFDLLSKEGRAKSAIEKNIKRTQNKFLQSPDRFAAMKKLAEAESEDAIYGLCRRFSFVYDKLSEDEQEKEWVADVLASMGERAVPSLSRYLLGADTVSYPLRVLEKVAPADRVLEVVDKLLAREEPGYTRDPSKKIQILTWLAEWKGAAVADKSRRVVPYLADFDEGVRFAAVEALAHGKHQDSARGPLLDAMLRPEEESRRIKVRIAEVLAEAQWPVTDRKDQVAKLLAADLPEFGMQHDKLQRKK